MAWAIAVYTAHDPGDEETEPQAWLSYFNQRTPMKRYAMGWKNRDNPDIRASMSCPLAMGETLVVVDDPDIAQTSNAADRQPDAPGFEV